MKIITNKIEALDARIDLLSATTRSRLANLEEIEALKADRDELLQYIKQNANIRTIKKYIKH